MARGKRDVSKSKSAKKANDDNPVSEVIGLVKTYAKQEALDPLGNALRWLGFGAAGAVCLAVGLSLALLGLLRLLQTETGEWFDGNWSWCHTHHPRRGGHRDRHRRESHQEARSRQGGEWSMTEQRVTRDDIEAKLRAIQSDVVDRVESKRSTVLTGATIAAVLLLILVYLLGRRTGKRKTTIVEIRRV